MTEREVGEMVRVCTQKAAGSGGESAAVYIFTRMLVVACGWTSADAAIVGGRTVNILKVLSGCDDVKLWDHRRHK